MHGFLGLMAAIVAGLISLHGPPAEARRVALVIGNADYRVGPLTNPVNDAVAMADVLGRQLKFDKVMLRTNLGANAFRAALLELSREAAGAELGVVYFAGHGTEVDGKNFLVPVDATLARSSALSLEAIPLDAVLAQLEGVTNLRLVILDACRNNVFGLAGAKRSLTRGLARIEPEGNTLVAFAAKEGTTADDGKGPHSPFTAALMKRIATPGLDVRRLFGYVSEDVLAATSRTQEPWLYGRLGGDEVFLLPRQLPHQTPVSPPERNEAAEAWAAVQNSTSIAQLEVIARRYKGTVYADLARVSIDELRREEAKKAKTALAPPPRPSLVPPPPPPLAQPSPPTVTWRPTKPVQIIIPAGIGGGLDSMARFIQGVVAKHNAMRQPIVVLNKAAGAGAEGLLELKRSGGDPHTIMIAASNLFTTPLATGVPVSWRDLTPVAMLALDQFILWVPADAPYSSARAYIEAVRSGSDRSFKMGGSGIKQEDQIITSALERITAPKRFIYIPYKGGGAVIVQLVGRSIHSSVSNPIEAVSQWKAGAIRPLCIFSSRRSLHTLKVTATMSWSDIPTCREAGVDAEYQMFRGIFMPPGVQAEHVAYYVDLLTRVMATDDWRTYMRHGAFSETFMTGGAFKAWLESNDRLHYDLMRGAGLLAAGR